MQNTQTKFEDLVEFVHPDWDAHDEDSAFFELNPDRSYRLRRLRDGEYFGDRPTLMLAILKDDGTAWGLAIFPVGATVEQVLALPWTDDLLHELATRALDGPSQHIALVNKVTVDAA